MNRVLYEAADFPILQNRVYRSRKEALSCPRGDIRLIEDGKTGLIYNDAFRSDLISYDENYNNEQANSPYFQIHLERVKEIIRRELGVQSLVEVGCGKGFFLERLLADGFTVTGFDPSYDGNNPLIVKEYFKPGVINPSHGLILRHVLEHVADPYSFLCDLRDANGGQGLVYIEVPCFDWICSKRAWFDIFYEHVNYFRLYDLTRMFGSVQASGRIFGDQYIYLVANLATLRPPRYDKHHAIRFPDDFLESLNSSQESTSNRAVVWGGASKGVIFTILRARAGRTVDAVVDVNPIKQGHFLPLTGLKILSPESFLQNYSSCTTVYVMNSNYIDEIKAMSSHRYNYVGVDR